MLRIAAHQVGHAPRAMALGMLILVAGIRESWMRDPKSGDIGNLGNVILVAGFSRIRDSPMTDPRSGDTGYLGHAACFQMLHGVAFRGAEAQRPSVPA